MVSQIFQVSARFLWFAMGTLACVLPAQSAEVAGDPPVAAPARFSESLATRDSLASLRAGGYVLYMRHGLTDNAKADRFPAVDLNDCNTQRPLTDVGRAMASRVGDALREAKIPIGDVQISPLCRVKETATLVLKGKPFTIDEGLMYTANMTTAQKSSILVTTRQLLSSPVPRGENRLIIAHAPNLMDLIGYFPKEGTVAVFRPKGSEGFQYLFSIPPSLWPDLLR